MQETYISVDIMLYTCWDLTSKRKVKEYSECMKEERNEKIQECLDAQTDGQTDGWME